MVHNKRMIDAAQKGFLLLLTNAWQTASTDALQVLAGDLPFDLEAIRAAANWYVERGLEFQVQDLRVERIPDFPDGMRLHLALSKRKAVKQMLMTTWQKIIGMVQRRAERPAYGYRGYDWLRVPDGETSQGKLPAS
jgi:hypothetical protein